MVNIFFVKEIFAFEIPQKIAPTEKPNYTVLKD